MILKQTVLRIARPTDNLQTITRMYIEGMGFKLLASFSDHDGFDGAIVGLESHLYHLEFTHHRGTRAGNAPGQDNLLVFYLPDEEEWLASCIKMQAAGFKKVESYNPWWDVAGKTFEDVDGYRVVLHRGVWSE